MVGQDSERINAKCPKCGSRTFWIHETIEAISEHKIVDGHWDHDYDANEYGNGLCIEFKCDKCGHEWRGRKGPTIEGYIEY